MATEDAYASVFPEEILKKGYPLGGEYGFPLDAARDVLNFLRRSAVAILGVEVWIPVGGDPRVVAISEYEVDRDADWPSYVNRTADAASKELARTGLPSNALFNFTWMTEVQAKSQDRRS